MKYRNLIDTHTHSVLSFDGNHSCEEMCEGAIKNGAVGIAITDHCDIDGKDEDFVDFCRRQFESTARAKEEYKGKIEVYQGLELGQGIFRKELSEQILSEHNYDFVLGSIHNLENMEDFYFLDYSKYDINSLLTEYFNALLELTRWNQTDSLAHLTYPLRYIVAREHINVDISRYFDVIDEIFRTLIVNEKALEINTSGLFMEMNDTLPDKTLIKRYHDMGGRYVTVGSDSHYKEKVCQGLDAAYDILKECHYDKITVFKNRKPVLIDIE